MLKVFAVLGFGAFVYHRFNKVWKCGISISVVFVLTIIAFYIGVYIGTFGYKAVSLVSKTAKIDCPLHSNEIEIPCLDKNKVVFSAYEKDYENNGRNCERFIENSALRLVVGEHKSLTRIFGEIHHPSSATGTN